MLPPSMDVGAMPHVVHGHHYPGTGFHTVTGPLTPTHYAPPPFGAHNIVGNHYASPPTHYEMPGTRYAMPPDTQYAGPPGTYTSPVTMPPGTQTELDLPTGSLDTVGAASQDKQDL